MPNFYVARHGSGRVHLRKTDRVYTHAVVGPRMNEANWAGRLDLATKQLGGKYIFDAAQVVPVEVVDAAEFARLNKAGKRRFKTVFMGKTYTKTVSADFAGERMFAVGVDRIEHAKRFPARPESIERAEANLAYFEDLKARFGAGHDSAIARARQVVEKVKEDAARGYVEVRQPAHREVVWVYKSEQALHHIKVRNVSPAFQVAVELEVTEVA